MPFGGPAPNIIIIIFPCSLVAFFSLSWASLCASCMRVRRAAAYSLLVKCVVLGFPITTCNGVYCSRPLIEKKGEQEAHQEMR